MEDDGEKDDIPPPDPGFIRPPALVHQLALLRDNPGISYVITQPEPKPDHGIKLAHAMGEMLFELCKTRAIKNGDPDSVAMMWSVILPLT